MDKKAVSGSIIFLIIIPIAIAVLIILYYAISDQRLKIGYLSLALALAVMALIILYVHFFSSSSRLRKKLQLVPSITQGESIEKMKQYYQEIYNLYTRLAERHKPNFYANITEIRERIERKLKADKKMELLVLNIGKGSLADQNSNYREMFELYRRLPEAVKQKYYAHLVHARKLLEKSD
ncbi:MAG TPA: hypothetical protein VJH68_01850 [Candidatus Nanoarchaeia archaeon]|nr:hypothetical protein [Candidatus Nanoarchaeia archaeon]